jgi:hypothetical protein
LTGETGNCFRLQAEDRRIVMAFEFPDALYNKAKILVSSEFPRDHRFPAQYDAAKKTGMPFAFPFFRGRKFNA